MNNRDADCKKLERSLEALSARVPDLPLTQIMLCRLLQHLGREMATMLEHQIRPFGLAEAEFRVLMTLFSQPDGVANPSELCARASQSPANMSRISDALVSRDLITRVLSSRDRRRMVLRITEQGEELVRRLLPTVTAPVRALFAQFSESAQRDLVAQLKVLSENIGQIHKQDADRAL
jgi:MarR family transcriptional repressor of emrRAB